VIVLNGTSVSGNIFTCCACAGPVGEGEGRWRHGRPGRRHAPGQPVRSLRPAECNLWLLL